MAKLLKNDRLESIIRLVSEKGRVRVMDLAGTLKVTDETIRNDLKYLAKQGKIGKVHGGAEPLFKKNEVDIPLPTKNQLAIATKASSTIFPNEVIFMDGSAECIALSKLLSNQPLTVYTNSPAVMVNLAIHSDIKIVGIGGTYDHRTRTLIPDQDVPIPSVIFSNVFFSCEAFNTSLGIMERSKDNSYFLSKILEKSPIKRTLLIEKEKLNTHANFLVPITTEGTVIIVNENSDTLCCRTLMGIGYNVITC